MGRVVVEKKEEEVSVDVAMERAEGEAGSWSWMLKEPGRQPRTPHSLLSSPLSRGVKCPGQRFT